MKRATIPIILTAVYAVSPAMIVHLDAPINTIAVDSFEEYDDALTQVENGGLPWYDTLSVLDGAATFSAVSGGSPTTNALQVIQPDKGSSIQLGGFGLATVRTGVQHAVSSTPIGISVLISFSEPAFGFGGFFQLGDQGRLRVRFYRENGSQLTSSTEFVTRNNSERFFLGWYGTDGDRIKTIRFDGFEGTGAQFAYDDIMLYESVPEPATLMAIGVGIAGVWARRKRK